MLPPSRIAAGRVVASSTGKGTATGVPKKVEVIRHGPPRSGNSINGGNGYSNSSINSNLGDDHSVVSAITMDIHLFQSFGGGDDSLNDEINASDDDLPPTSYHRRPGPERIRGRNYYNRGQRTNANTFNSYERRHSTGGDIDSYYRRRRRSSNNNSMGSSNHSGRSHNRYPHPSAPPTMARNLSPPDDYGHGTRMDTRSRPPTSSSAAAAAVGRSYIESDENSHGSTGHVVPNTTRESKAINKNSMRSQGRDFRIDGNVHTRQNMDAAQARQWRVSSNENKNQSSNTRAMINNDDEFPSFMMDENDGNNDYDYNRNKLQQQQRQQQNRQFESNDHRLSAITPASSPSSSGPQLIDSNDSDRRKKSTPKSNPITEEQDINDMPSILRCLNLEECNPDYRKQALCKLASIMQSTGQGYHAGDRERRIREFILENDVIEAVTKSMWADMEIVEVQEAAMNVLLFIAASMDIAYTGVSRDGEQHNSNGGNSILSKNESVCDSILFIMQNHVAVHEIQLKGSLIFASLAANSSDSNNVGTNADGSLSGAMTMVLNAMSNHGESRPIRKAGLQALHHQCLLSTYAEDNKRNFVESKLGNGMPAIDLVIYAMEELQKDIVAMEWACQLCWCLTANEDSLKEIEHASLQEASMTICQHYMTKPVGIGLVEASVGTIANLACREGKRKEMINTGAVELILDGLRYHGDDFGISYEATLALENFALPPFLPDVSSMLLKSEAVPLLIKGLKTFLDCPEYVVQGLRALTGIAARSDEAKGRISSPEIISIVHESSRKHRTTEVLVTCSIFVATLAMGNSTSVLDSMMEQGVVDLLLFAMECSHDEKVQDAACLALRNLSCHIQESEELLKGGKTAKFVVSAMDAHRNSVSIQTNGCCIFWNLMSKANEKEFDFNPKIVTSITKAMQSHIESSDLLELACGALWVVIDRFHDQKIYVGDQAIDVVTCAMVMHPGTTSTLEKACGFLSSLSCEESLARTIAKAQGVSIVSEAMCNNASSISLLESGCLTLKNIILVCPSYAHDGAVAISTLVMAMKENVESTSFVKEACDVLWVLASENENIRSKVLALDGISILMKCLEQNSNHPEVETSALGAFNQLAKAN